MQPLQTHQEKQWTTGEVLTWTTNRFKQADVETPLLDAQLLMCKVLNTTKIKLYTDYEKPLTLAESPLLHSREPPQK